MSRELDALVWTHVFGYIVEHDLQWGPDYSTDIGAAWQVVEKMRGRYVLNLTNGNSMEPMAVWSAIFKEDVGSSLEEHEGEAASAPLAICLAALRAVGVEP